MTRMPARLGRFAALSRSCCRLATLILLCGALACSSSPPPSPPAAATPPPPAAGEPPTSPPDRPVVRQMFYRYRMDSPANDDFAFNDDLVFIYARPFDTHLSMKVQARRQIPIKIYWNDSEFIDVIGRRYKLVPPSVTLEMAARNIVPPTELRENDIFSNRVLLLDPTQTATIRNLGGTPFPIVPADAGPPEQVRGKSFTMRLVLEIGGNRQTYDFIFSILDAYYRDAGP